MVNVCLISPPEKHMLMEAGDRPNLGILYLAASLKEAGHIPFISDLNHDSYRQLNEKIEKSDFIAMTTITPYFNWIKNFSTHLKFNYPDKPLIAGGPHATVDSESIKNNFDYIVKGEGEKAIVDIVEGKVKEKIVQYPYEMNLDSLPIPHRIMPEEYKYGLNQEGYNTMVLLSSRSCPYNCFFCTHKILGEFPRFHSEERVIQEINELRKKGYNSFYFVDDCFTVNKKRALNIAQRIIDNDFNITYRATSRTDTIDEKLLRKMCESGLRSISFGLEHFDNKVLKRIQKQNTVENHIKAIKLAKDVGVKIRGSFIINLPRASKKTAYKTLDLAMKYNLEFADFYALIAYPGTDIWNYPERYHAKINKNYGFFQTGLDTNVWFKNFGWDVNKLIQDIRQRWADFKGLKCPWEGYRK